jgi:hypothetical protein
MPMKKDEPRKIRMLSGLAATLYRMKNPKLAEVYLACKTAISHDPLNRKELRGGRALPHLLVLEILAGDKPVYFILGRYLTKEKHVRKLIHDYYSNLEILELASYYLVLDGVAHRQCTPQTKTIIEALKRGVPPNICALLE